ncbi:hypothetical protein JTE90_016421 [Oedothorax gibbosus]|uniref:Uncharacterized protein n=1 Tax=Oedothorax gibbosus TaxID=931172 RepID=A0AAV6TD46_9ARAC|nr:hypothetical protein JTE90_016421 [Oedothorax gibbosus]
MPATIRFVPQMTRRASFGKPKLLGSGGSMVAKLNLKELTRSHQYGGLRFNLTQRSKPSRAIHAMSAIKSSFLDFVGSGAWRSCSVVICLVYSDNGRGSSLQIDARIILVPAFLLEDWRV